VDRPAVLTYVGCFLADYGTDFLTGAGFVVNLGFITDFDRRVGFVTGKLIFNGAYRALAARVPRLD